MYIYVDINITIEFYLRYILFKLNKLHVAVRSVVYS